MKCFLFGAILGSDERVRAAQRLDIETVLGRELDQSGFGRRAVDHVGPLGGP